MKRKFYIIFYIIMALLITGCGDKKVKSSDNDVEEKEVYKEKEIDIEIQEGTVYKISYDDFQDYEDNEMFLKVLLQYQYRDYLNDAKNYVDDYINDLITMYGDTLEESLQEFGYESIDDYRQEGYFSYLYELATMDYAKTMVNEKDIENYYDEYIFGPITAKHILVSIEDDEELALMEAKDIIKRLNDGESFEELAKKYSDDKTTSKDGGLLEKIEHGDLSIEIEEAILKLENGSYTNEPVSSSYGYHVLYRVSQDKKPSLSEVRDSIVDVLAGDFLNEADMDFFNRAKDEIVNNVIQELKTTNNSELLIDDEFYYMYDLEGKAIYGVCTSENCMTRDFYQIDNFDEIEILDYN